VSPRTDPFLLASEHFQARRWQQAEALLGELVRVEPRNAPALHLLGVIAFRQGRHEQATDWFGRAAEACPDSAHYHSCHGAALHGLGRFEEAHTCHRRALALAPADGLVLNNLGITLMDLARTDEAADAFRGALAADPGDPATITNLGAALQRLYRTAEAEALHREALRLRSDLPQVHHNLGIVLEAQRRHDEAEASYRQALWLNPNFARSWHSLGDLLQARGRLDDAAGAYRRVLALQPDNSTIHCRLGQALLGLNRTSEALDCCREACRLGPDNAEATNDLGNVYQALGQLDEAAAAYERALRPGWSVPRYNLGVARCAQGRLEDARAAFAQAQRDNPADAVAHSTAVAARHYDPQANAAVLLAEAMDWAERHTPEGPFPTHANDPDPDPGRRLRVGYVSPDFRNHAVAFFLQPILAHHDPAAVEVFCYAEVPAPDARTAELRRLAHQWRDTAGLSHEELAALIRRDGIDVLVDLAGHLSHNRLLTFALRPAPIQVSYLGYPGTTGLDAIDYRLVDAVTDLPGELSWHTEELVQLPGPFCCYAPPPGVPLETGVPSARTRTITFGSLHKLEKLNPAVVNLWCTILRDVPGARLLLCRNTLQGPTADYWLDQFARRGIEAGRVEARRVEAVNMGHLRAYSEIDVALDTFPWSGHTTACEALWMGVPVVTLRGGRHAGRMTASVLTHAGLADLVAATSDEYRRLAAELARDETRRAELRRTLREQLLTSPLCDGKTFTRGLEAAYRQMWRRWCDRWQNQEARDGPISAAAPRHAARQPAELHTGDSRGKKPMPRKYLVGPVTADLAWRQWQGPRAAGECCAFNATGDTDLTVRPGDSWEDVLGRLPPGWHPDCVFLYLPYTTVPSCLWSAPVPLIGLALDWNLLWHAYRHALPRCDLILTDAPGVVCMQRAGRGHARVAQLFGLDRTFTEAAPAKEAERDIDVLFVGNMHAAVQRERLAWLGRLAALGERWRVVLATGVFGDDYRALLRRARVVFNRSIRGERNLRVAEAAWAGALLLQEEGNEETAAHFHDRRECVFYNEDNLEDLLEHYLSHEDERRTIAEAARRRAPEFAFDRLWAEVLGVVAAEWPALSERAQRSADRGGDALLARTWQALGAADGGDSALPNHLAAALASCPRDAGLHNALGVAVTLAGRQDGRVTAALAARAADHFRQAVASDPHHRVAALNLVEALVGINQNQLAVEGARRALAALDRGPGLSAAELDAPHFPPGFDHFRVEWERAAWEHAGSPAAEARAKADLLRWRLHVLLADLTGELVHFHEAAVLRPDLPVTRAALGSALGRAGRPAEAVAHLRAAVTANPFDRAAAVNLSHALGQSGDAVGARRLARDRRRLANAAPQLVPAEDWFAQAPPVGDELASLIILCCNEVGYTRQCLESVLEHTRPPYELILVDNGSTDGTPAYLDKLRTRRGPQRVEILRNASNRGFAAGCNQGLAAARGRYLVLLNNDTVVTAGWLDGLVNWSLHNWPKVGLVGAVTNYSRPPQQIPVDYPDLGGLADFAARRRQQFAGQALPVDRLAGFCLLARREALNALGNFDEGFGLGFFEDDDLSVRAVRAGFGLLVALDVFVHHFGSRTFAALGVDCPAQLRANFGRFRDKWGEQESAGYRMPTGGAPEVAASPTVVAAARPEQPRVSLCMIVKNEEENLPACLGSAADLVDEIVVVDTGSSDHTKEVAARFGAKIVDFPWVDSFAAARNESLRHATGKWIFWLDADDRLDEENRQKLRALFAGLGEENAAYAMKCLCLPDAATGTATVVDHVRLFRNHPQVRWEYRVHEQILPAVRRTGGEVRWADAVVHHAGYQDPALRGRKLQRDLRLLQLEDADRPDDPFTLFNLGSVYQELGRHAEALPLLRRSLEKSHPQDSIVRKLFALIVQCHRNLGSPAEALVACHKGLEVCPDDTELLFVEGILRRELGDLHGAEAALLKLLDAKPAAHFASVDAGLKGYKARHNLAVVYLQQGQTDEAEAQWRSTVAERPDFLPGWLGLAEMHLRQGRWEELDQVVQRLEQVPPHGAVEAAVLRARGHLARREFDTARSVLAGVIAGHPQALEPRVVLSHAFLQEGKDLDTAERALRAVLALAPQHAEAQHNLALLLQGRQRQAVTDDVFTAPAALPVEAPVAVGALNLTRENAAVEVPDRDKASLEKPDHPRSCRK
jgi:predicted O-linked N-acetylglucosamine transferase (SPINDLY family)/GT2 family glycosyltransferase